MPKLRFESLPDSDTDTTADFLAGPPYISQFQFVDLPLVLVKLPEPCMFCLKIA